MGLRADVRNHTASHRPVEKQTIHTVEALVHGGLRVTRDGSIENAKKRHEWAKALAIRGH